MKVAGRLGHDERGARGRNPRAAALRCGGGASNCLRFILKTIIQPRQARDKHRENSKTRCVFLGEEGRRWFSVGYIVAGHGH
eukprot:COSAG06_NODE_35555_length_458_cov_1.913649_1_plen_81_part_10